MKICLNQWRNSCRNFNWNIVNIIKQLSFYFFSYYYIFVLNSSSRNIISWVMFILLILNYFWLVDRKFIICFNNQAVIILMAQCLSFIIRFRLNIFWSLSQQFWIYKYIWCQILVFIESKLLGLRKLYFVQLRLPLISFLIHCLTVTSIKTRLR